MPATRTAAPCFAFAALLVAGPSAVRPAHAQQTLVFAVTAAAQSGTAPTPYGDVTIQATTAAATVTLTAGVPQTVALGSLSAGYSTGSFPNGTSVPFAFGFTRLLSASVSGGSFAFTEPISGSGLALRGGSVGQYGSYFFSIFSALSTAGLGPLGIVQAQWQSSAANSDGLSASPASLSAILTFVPAPEPSSVAALALGAIGLSALTVRARKRQAPRVETRA